MSADLFAAFETPAQSSNHAAQKQNPDNKAQSSTTIDPFSLLSSTISAPPPSNSQFSSQWPSVPQQAASQLDWGTWPAQQPSKTTGGAFGDIDSLQKGGTTQDEDDDAWGDFEVAPTNVPQPPPVKTEPPLPRTRILRADTIDLMTNKLVDVGISSTLEPWQERPSWEKKKEPMPAKKADPNVLFDAEDFELQTEEPEDDDDFGDFETGASAVTAPAAAAPAAPAPVPSAFDLLSSLDSDLAPPPKKQPPGLLLSSASLASNPTPYPQAPKSPYGSFQNRKPEQIKQLQVKTPVTPEFPQETKTVKNGSPTPVTAWPTVADDGFGDDWAEFKDLPESKPKPGPSKTKQTTSKPAAAPADWEWNAWGESEPKEKSSAVAPLPQDTTPTGPPPTNIPPPSVLLSIFPQLLDLASSALLKPVNGLATPAQQRVLSEAATATFLRGYLALATVAARIIAGRKQRWHRDKFLMQGMAISAAASGGAKTRGMKLAGVDKTQAAREDREAAEVVAVWKQLVGRLRSTMVAVNGAHPGEVALRVPELGLVMTVQTVQGVPTAPRACVVCGLKRDERVARVDVEVEDSFGEWWVEFWGHRACRNFWLEHEVKLRQR
ncbi:hypothetical protein QBC47DRAFT_390842 [Echria macrotheca]|uniref:Uncharacterized protein n=1 Tax=Echria macrotheca TaxID=438768 RepID=A0AAJ0F310_9PEZI|nr:hypothetical protein QBC47DRAFT_390842 [Echria macrotheca]